MQSDWEESSEEEEEKPKSAAAAAAPPKKKGTLKQKLAEKEAEKAQRKANGDVEYDSDDVLDPREKARRDKEREIAADIGNAADLLGAAALGGALSSSCLWARASNLITLHTASALIPLHIQVPRTLNLTPSSLPNLAPRKTSKSFPL